MRYLVLALVATYLLGSIPFPFLVVRRVTGLDLRHVGNGNVGARNAIRVAGPQSGILALLLDACKGAAAYAVGLLLSAEHPLALYAAAAGVLVGHWFPLWLRFRGGVGQAAVVGFLIAMWPLAGLVGVVIFLVARPLLRPFNVAFAVAAVAYLSVGWFRHGVLQGIILTLVFMALISTKKVLDMPRQKRILGDQK